MLTPDALAAIRASIEQDVADAKRRYADVPEEDFDAIVGTYVHRRDALALLDALDEARVALARAERERDGWRVLSEAQDRLLVAYRTGNTRLGAKASQQVSEARAALAGREQEEGT